MKIKGSDDYYVLLCDCGNSRKHPMICGVLASRKEAQDLAEEVKGCESKHTIKKCKVTVEI